MDERSYHVVPREGCWAVTRGGAPGVCSTHPSREAAIVTARRLAQADDAALVIHRRDGTIQTGGDHELGRLPPQDANR